MRKQRVVPSIGQVDPKKVELLPCHHMPTVIRTPQSQQAISPEVNEHLSTHIVEGTLSPRHTVSPVSRSDDPYAVSYTAQETYGQPGSSAQSIGGNRKSYRNQA